VCGNGWHQPFPAFYLRSRMCSQVLSSQVTLPWMSMEPRKAEWRTYDLALSGDLCSVPLVLTSSTCGLRAYPAAGSVWGSALDLEPGASFAEEKGWLCEPESTELRGQEAEPVACCTDPRRERPSAGKRSGQGTGFPKVLALQVTTVHVREDSTSGLLLDAALPRPPVSPRP
jgi:hypothetical protein